MSPNFRTATERVAHRIFASPPLFARHRVKWRSGRKCYQVKELRNLRLTLGASWMDVANVLGVSRQTVEYYEKGSVSAKRNLNHLRERIEAQVAARKSLQQLARIPGVKEALLTNPELAAKCDPTKQMAATDLRLTRQAWGATLTDVARVLGIRPSTLSNWEHGRCMIPRGLDLDGLRGQIETLAAERKARITREREARAQSSEERRQRNQVNGKAFRRVRLALGVSQHTVAHVLGVNQRTVFDWEKGRLKCRPILI
jgi:DNA-binding transcriptional regulator YiaG